MNDGHGAGSGRYQPLDEQAIAGLMQALPGWQVEAGRTLHRDFEFPDFRQAFGFMTQVALLAERHDHHPDWSNSYRRVTVRFTTHDLGGLSTRDVDMARRVADVFAASGARQA